MTCHSSYDSQIFCAVAGCVGTRDDEELKELFDNAESFDLSFFSNNTIAEFAKHFISTGTLHDARVLQMRLKRLLGNATFLQAFQHSGRPLSICLARMSMSKQYLCFFICPNPGLAALLEKVGGVLACYLRQLRQPWTWQITQLLINVKQMCLFCKACQQHHQIFCPDFNLQVSHGLRFHMTSLLASLQRLVMTSCSCAGRILNVAVCPADTNEPPRVLNYLTAPHVYVWSAVSCSSAFPLLFAPQDLKCRNADGEEVM